MYSTAAGGPGRPPNDETSLGELFLRVLRFYQRFYRLLLPPALILGAFAAWWTASKPLYTASALLEVPDVSLEEWRQAQAFLWDQRWVEKNFANVDPPALKNQALDPLYWTTTVRYRSALTRDDLRDVPVAELQKTRGLGLDLVLRARDTAQASGIFDALTRQVRQALLANNLISLIRDDQQALARRPQLNLDLLQVDFEIRQQRQRIKDMSALLERYPETRKIEPNTVVSVSDGGGKYLAPLVQIVALETTVSELQSRSYKLRHDLEKLDWTAQLVAGMDETIRKASSGDEIFRRLRENHDKLLAEHPQMPTVGQEAAQDLSLKLALAEARQQAIGLKSRSALSEAPITTRRPLFAGLFVFAVTWTLLSVLLAIHAFLRQGRDVLPWLPKPLRRMLMVDLTP